VRNLVFIAPVVYPERPLEVPSFKCRPSNFEVTGVQPCCPTVMLNPDFLQDIRSALGVDPRIDHNPFFSSEACAKITSGWARPN
jgi:hypothetical protein